MIEVLACGPLNTVQDQGRFGFRNLGVSTAGPMDPLAHRLAALLCGATPDAAGIEVQTFPFKMKFHEGARFAIVGAHCAVTLGGRHLLPWSAATAAAGDELLIMPPAKGARSYIAFASGIALPTVLGSRATDLRAGFGGFDGRSLRVGDRLAFGEDHASSGLARLQRDIALVIPMNLVGAVYGGAPNGLRPATVRLIAAAEYELFSKEERRAFFDTIWTLSPQSNRTGFRFTSGHKLVPPSTTLASHGIVAGVIQVPADGEPIIQLADAKTAGGYPKIGCVIEADLWRLAQLPLGSRVRFELVDHHVALAVEQDQHLYFEEIARNLELSCAA